MATRSSFTIVNNGHGRVNRPYSDRLRDDFHSVVVYRKELMRHTIIASAAALAFIHNAHAAVQTVEADNGAVYRITETRQSVAGGMEAVVYPPGAPNDDVDPMLLWFDCKGHMKRFDRMGPMKYVPPNSVAGRIAQIACARTHS